MNLRRIRFIMLLVSIIGLNVKGQKHDTILINQLLDSALKIEFSDNALSQRITKAALSLSQKKGNERFNSKALVIMGYLHDDIGALEEAKKYYEQSLAINTKLGNKKALGLDYSNLGLNAENKGDLMEAISYQTKALQIREEIKDTFGIAASNNNIGNIYGRQGDYTKALSYFLKSLQIVELSKNEDRLPPQLNNIAIIYNRLKNYDKAIEYYERALKIWERNKNTDGMAIANYNIANVYKNNMNYEKALIYANEALRLNKEIGNKPGIAECYDILGSIYSVRENYVKALSYFNLALKLKLEINDNSELVNIYGNLASVNIALGNNLEALPYLDKALPLAEKNRMLIELKEIYKQYYKIYKSTNNYPLSLKFHELYFSINDSVYNIESTKQLNELNTRYETDKKEKENQLLSAKNALSEKTIKEQQLITYFIIAGLLIVIIFAFFIFRGLKKQRLANQIISQQKLEVENQKQIIEEHQKEMLDSIHYAKRIQYTLLAHHDFVKEHLPQNFIFFKPKDIVSGDFYWATKHGNRFYLAVCDSTGHGVPGAFMSLLNIGFLSEAINEKNILEPHKVFDYVRQRLTASVSKEGQKDGFDGILVCFEKDSNEVTYAAAHNAPILFSNGTITELPKDKMPVGIGERKEEFTLHKVKLNGGDILYLYTDGYADQFGGPKGKKFKYKALNDLLQSKSSASLNEQASSLEKTFEDWKGSLEQVDDVCIVGIKF